MLRRILFAVLFIYSTIHLNAQIVENPNFIVFYVDDLGWQDTKINEGLVGDTCPYDTPRMLELAKKGMNFTQAYSPAPLAHLQELA